MSFTAILLILLVLALIGVLPLWPHARTWGYMPSGFLGAAFVIVVVFVMLGRA